MIDLRVEAIWSKLRFFTQPGKRLSQRVAFAGAWMLALRVTARGLAMVRLIVLARILTPEAFGLVAIALLIMELMNQLTATGFNTALIQRKGSIKDYLDTVWTMLAIRGLVLGGLLFGTAPLAAGLFNAPDAKPFVQAMAAVLVVYGFANSGLVYFSKELEVHKRFAWQMSSTVAEIAVAVSAALILRNAWALVYGSIAGSIVGVIVSYVIHPYRPRLRLDFQKAKELFGFGMWVLFSAVAVYIFSRVDSIYVGRFLGVAALGLYGMAHRIGDPIAEEVSNLTSSVAFPAYSKLQDNLPKLRQAFLAGIEAIVLVTFPFAVAIFVLAPDFTPLVLGNQWVPAIPAMRILGIAAAISALQSAGGSLLFAVGKPRLVFLTLVVASLVMVVLLAPLSRQFGLTGAAMAMLAGNGVGLLFIAWALRRILNLSVKDLVRLLISPFTVSLLLGVTLVLVKRAVGQVGLGEFISILCIAAVVYAASSLLLWRFFRSGLLQILALLRGGGGI